jgi:hypothetical protein
LQTSEALIDGRSPTFSSSSESEHITTPTNNRPEPGVEVICYSTPTGSPAFRLEGARSLKGLSSKSESPTTSPPTSPIPRQFQRKQTNKLVDSRLAKFNEVGSYSNIRACSSNTRLISVLSFRGLSKRGNKHGTIQYLPSFYINHSHSNAGKIAQGLNQGVSLWSRMIIMFLLQG